jgi:hypothetical protein
LAKKRQNRKSNNVFVKEKPTDTIMEEPDEEENLTTRKSPRKRMTSKEKVKEQFGQFSNFVDPELIEEQE